MSDPRRLIPCPFCHGNNLTVVVETHGDTTCRYVSCGDCMGRGPICSSVPDDLGTEVLACEAWNGKYFDL